MTFQQICLVIDNNLADVSLMGSAVKALCVLFMPESACIQVELCIVEAVNNVIKHAYRHQSGVIEVQVRFYADYGEFMVCDQGEAMAPREAPSFEFDPLDIANLPEGGMGRFLIHRIMDQVSYTAGVEGNCLRMVKYWDAPS